MQRTPTDLANVARRAGLQVVNVERVPVPGGAPGQTTLASRMQFNDPWAAARLLDALADEDAGDPWVRAWSLDILRNSMPRTMSGPNVEPEDLERFSRAIHANVQRQVRFVREPNETFQSARVTMQALAGDCDDHARLVHSLARASGAPSRLVYFVKDAQPVHVVAQLADAGGRWRFAETTIPAAFGEHPKDAFLRLLSQGRVHVPREDLGDVGAVAGRRVDVANAPGAPVHRRARWTLGGLVPTVKTPLTSAQALGALLAAGVSQSALLMVAAQSAVETAGWAAMAGFNFGNVTPSQSQIAAGVDYDTQGITGMKYIVYPDAVTGASGMIGWLHSHGLLPLAEEGNLEGYVQQLEAGCYLGCVGNTDPTGHTVSQTDYDNYQAGISSWMQRLENVVPQMPGLTTGAKVAIGAGVAAVAVAAFAWWKPAAFRSMEDKVKAKVMEVFR